MMKKIIIVTLLCLMMIGTTKVHAAGITKHGHPEIIELDFYDEDEEYLLINQYTSREIKRAYKDVERRFVGWSVDVFLYEIPIWYISDCIMSRSNKTNEVINVKYDTAYSITETLTTSASGSLAGKMSGKIKGVTASLDATMKADITKQTKNYYEEKVVFSLTIYPGKKVSLLVRGDADLSNGVGIYYFFGIPVNKGTWEYIDVKTEYYELIEEDL